MDGLVVHEMELLALTQWKKVMFCDADLCFVRNADDLFDLPAPAGCFSTPWPSHKHWKGT